MLSDRNYMGYKRRNPRDHAGEGLMMLWMTIIVNVVVAVVFGFENAGLDRFLGFSIDGLRHLKLWQPVTYMFLHGGWLHLIFNMYGLYLFGSFVAPELGTNRFMGLYFVSGIAAAFIWGAFNVAYPYHYVVGASGALFGVLIAAALVDPDRELYLMILPTAPVKLKIMVIAYAVAEIFAFGVVSKNPNPNPNPLMPAENVAHMAHIGGLIGGYLFLKIFCKQLIKWDPLEKIWSNKTSYKTPRGWDLKDFTSKASKKVSQKELDSILDKISAHGVNSLSKEEMATLKKAREDIKNKK